MNLHKIKTRCGKDVRFDLKAQFVDENIENVQRQMIFSNEKFAYLGREKTEQEI